MFLQWKIPVRTAIINRKAHCARQDRQNGAAFAAHVLRAGRKGCGIVTFELSNGEFRSLLDLVYIGNWVLNATRGDDRIEEYDRLESKLFGLCRGTPLSALVETRLGISFPSRAFEEGGIQDAIAYYEDGVFYDILAEELARRDLEEAGETGDPAALNERMDRYIEEFNENGVDRIQIEGMEE